LALAGAFAHLFGGEKTIENDLLNIFLDAAAIVAHPNFWPVAVSAGGCANSAGSSFELVFL